MALSAWSSSEKMVEVSRFSSDCASGRAIALTPAVETQLLLVRAAWFPHVKPEPRAGLWSGSVVWASPKQVGGGWLRRAARPLVGVSMPPEKKQEPRRWPCSFPVPLPGTSEGRPSKQG